ncbi:glycosyltransferase family 4 protein [Thiomonas sp.]
MNILVVTRERVGDERFGLGRAIRSLCDAMRAAGHRVTLLDAASWTPADVAMDRRIRGLLSWVARRLRMVEAPIPAISERIVQVVRARRLMRSSGNYTHIWYQDSLLAIAHDWLGWRDSASVVISVHGLGSAAQSANLDGLGFDQRWVSILLPMERRALRRADLVFLPSAAAREHLVRDLGLAASPSHWHVVGHGRPTFKLPPRDESRCALGIGDGEYMVLAVGRVAPVKQYPRMLDAVAIVQRAVPHLRLVILGGAPTPELASRLAAMEPKPTFVPSGDVPVYLAAADAYLSACVDESYGLANVEALHAGVPSIVSAGGATPEVVGYGAWLCSPSAEAMAHALSRVVENDEFGRYLRRCAQERCGELPQWSQIASRYLELMGCT